MGRLQIKLRGLSGADLPVVRCRADVDPTTVGLLT